MQTTEFALSTVVLQFTQVPFAPPPQVLTVGELHEVPLQQPLVHEDALHAQAPPTHCWPDTQAAPPPHEHEPAELHWSARVALHAVQLEPFAPHSPRLGDVHVVPLQQPLPHDVESQTHAPFLQCWPALQGCPLPH